MLKEWRRQNERELIPWARLLNDFLVPLLFTSFPGCLHWPNAQWSHIWQRSKMFFCIKRFWRFKIHTEFFWHWSIHSAGSLKCFLEHALQKNNTFVTFLSKNTAICFKMISRLKSIKFYIWDKLWLTFWKQFCWNKYVVAYTDIWKKSIKLTKTSLIRWLLHQTFLLIFKN